MQIQPIGFTTPPSAAAPAKASSPDQVSLSSRNTVAEIERLLKGPTPRWSERKILDLLRSEDADGLNHVLQSLNLRHLFKDVNNHCFGPKHFTELLQLLTKERINELTVDSKIALVDGLMRGRSRSEDERAIRDLFLSTRGLELRAMKNGVDAGQDHYDLQNLIYHDMDDKAMRSQLTDHFHTQSAFVKDRQFKVLSDIDDTFYCNLKDTRYPRGTVYPGVRAFYAELTGDLTFLTARPQDPMGVIKDKTHKTLQKRGVEKKVVVAGTLGSLLSNEKIAAKKLENFNQVRHIFPEYDFVFTGDSGQGDVILASKMTVPEIRGRFIHDVVATPQQKREEYARQGIDFFDNYVGAALAAQARGAMSLDSVRRVAVAACDDFGLTAFADEPQRQARLAELQIDLNRLNAQLPSDQHVHAPALRPLEELPLPAKPSEPNY